MSLTLQKKQPRVINTIVRSIALKTVELSNFALQLYMKLEYGAEIKPEDLAALKEKKKELDKIMENLI